MRIENNLMHKLPAAPVQPQKEVPGEREPDGDADDRAKAVAQQHLPKQMFNEATGKNVNILA
jgi:hypothetical protein